MDSRDRFYGFSLLFNIFAEKKTYYAGIMLDAPSIVLCSKLCRHNVSDPKEVEGCPAKTAISPQIAKNWRNRLFSKIN